MSLKNVGPVDIDFHGDPTFSTTSSSDRSDGFVEASFGGLLEWTQAIQLKELVANKDAYVTIAGYTGILEYVYADDELLAPLLNGYWLLRTCSISAEQSHSVGSSPVPVTVGGLHLGDYEPS